MSPARIYGLRRLGREPLPPPGVQGGRGAGGEGRQSHRHHGGRQDDGVGARRDNVLAASQPGQQEGELADLKEPEPHGERDDVHVPERPGDAGEDHALPDKHDQDDGEDYGGGGEQERRVYEHPHGDEEEHGEHVAQGSYVGEGLVAVVRLGEDDAGDERPEGEGEPEEVGPVAHPEARGDHRDQEQLPRVEPGDAAHEPGKYPRPEDGHRRHEQGGLERRQPELTQSLPHVPELGQHDQQRHHRDVLDDEHPDDDPARERAEHLLLGEGLQDHGRARDGEQRPEPHGLLPP